MYLHQVNFSGLNAGLGYEEHSSKLRQKLELGGPCHKMNQCRSEVSNLEKGSFETPRKWTLLVRAPIENYQPTI